MSCITGRSVKMCQSSLTRMQPLFERSFVSKQDKSTSSKETPKKTESSKEGYQAPEYYQHNTFTFAEYDLAMVKCRLPQPSSKTK